ncbi:MAG: TPM domain-containing protein [Myxococcota bacterium]
MSEDALLLDDETKAAIENAIVAAEEGNRGEVRVHLEEHCDDAMKRAQQVFEGLGMRATQEDTGVLLYIAVKSRKTAVFAGSGIFSAAEPGFWKAAVDEVADGYRHGEPQAGITKALQAIGDLLREHVAGDDVAGDELPNVVTTEKDLDEEANRS